MLGTVQLDFSQLSVAALIFMAYLCSNAIREILKFVDFFLRQSGLFLRNVFFSSQGDTFHCLCPLLKLCIQPCIQAHHSGFLKCSLNLVREHVVVMVLQVSRDLKEDR